MPGKLANNLFGRLFQMSYLTEVHAQAVTVVIIIIVAAIWLAVLLRRS